MTTTTHKFGLGDKVKCQVTGHEGIIIALNKWLNGCKQYCVKGKIDKDKKVPEGEWIDEGQLKMVKKNFLNIKQKPTGGPNKDQQRG
jgi:hypothetical protein